MTLIYVLYLFAKNIVGGNYMRVYLLLANGFEEMEVTYPISILRVAEYEVVTVSISDSKCVVGSHGVHIVADAMFDEIDMYNADAIILPGGQPGTDNLASFEPLQAVIEYDSENKVVAAICAAPSILGNMGLLKHKEATCYPGYESALDDAVVSSSKVVTDGNIITASGPGGAKEFAFAIVNQLGTDAEHDKVVKIYR